MSVVQLLRELSEASGISGYEHSISDLVQEHFEPYCTTIRRDQLGNLVCVRKGTDTHGIKVMLAAHTDEIGFMVSRIESSGFLRVAPVGGVDPKTILNKEVLVHTAWRTVPGIIGTKPPHLTTGEERKKSVEFDDLFIDVGLPPSAVKAKVHVGDPITVRRSFGALHGRRVFGKALDDRSGVAVMFETLRRLVGLQHESDVYAVATVQEEVGLRGATTAAFGVNPDIAIAIDTGFGQQPGTPSAETMELGKGPGITLGPNISPTLREHLVAIARDHHIDFQIEVAEGNSGTDAWAIQVSRQGIPTALLSLPLRYMHSSVETLDLEDIINSGRLLAAFIGQLKGSTVRRWQGGAV